ncbi:MAG: alanine--tRNA ligase [Pirellulales bacterium]
MKTNELRERYLAFFESKGHVRCASDVLVPTWDPSVLFTPAGMNQFKDHFLGKVKLEFTRATTCQKCLRTGDIDNVGRTAYHHTFFEMLGNFSFGDYFKREAIHWAWEFLTDPKWLAMAPDRLSVSVYKDDDQAARIWQEEIQLSAAQIERMDEDENFWPANAPSLGPDGVCGPCSEIFYHPPSGSAVEIWNLVFTQFDRVGQPPDNLRPLPSKNIDTGMGLERPASVLQGVDSNFHIDLLLPIVRAAADTCHVAYQRETETGRRIRRIADHVRACTMAIHENVIPGPNKEKYVIRRLLRRAVLDGHQIGVREPFLYQLVPTVVQQMKTAYPELTETVERVASAIHQEEASFFGTIDAGLARIEKIFDDLHRCSRVTVDGVAAAELYQTYGVPPELVETMAAEHNLAFDWDGFRQAMARHGEASGKAVHTVMGDTGPVAALKKAVHQTEFVGYDATETTAHVKGIIAQGQLCDLVSDTDGDHPLVVVLDQTPFYGESGGQVGDAGEIVGDRFTFRVTDTQRDGELILHHGNLGEGAITAGDGVTARIDKERRQGIARAHSATHLLHFALQTVLGRHAQQQGSKVDDDWLRFDFSHLSPATTDQLRQIEQLVHEKIAAAEDVQCQVLPLADARQMGAMMLFGEKYPDPVRVVSMGTFSRELCGGTHLSSTGDVERLEIVGEEGVAAGTRRITALTGRKAREYVAQIEDVLQRASEALGVKPSQLSTAARALTQEIRELKKWLSEGRRPVERSAARPAENADRPLDQAERKMALLEAAKGLNVGPFDVADRAAALSNEVAKLRKQLQQQEATGLLTAEQLLDQAQQIDQLRLVIAETPGVGVGAMRGLIDQLRKKAAPVAVLLASREGDDKVTIVAGLSRDLVDQGGDAGKWVGGVARLLGGGGGGRPDMAQAGGKRPEQLPEALEAARQQFEQMMVRPADD